MAGGRKGCVPGEGAPLYVSLSAVGRVGGAPPPPFANGFDSASAMRSCSTCCCSKSSLMNHLHTWISIHNFVAIVCPRVLHISDEPSGINLLQTDTSVPHSNPDFAASGHEEWTLQDQHMSCLTSTACGGAFRIHESGCSLCLTPGPQCQPAAGAAGCPGSHCMPLCMPRPRLPQSPARLISSPLPAPSSTSLQ